MCCSITTKLTCIICSFSSFFFSPTKADFIRAKHQMLTFVNRPGKDDSYSLDGDLSKQLHSSVRTSNLETSLRLLSLGADPNYYHEVKSMSCNLKRKKSYVKTA